MGNKWAVVHSEVEVLRAGVMLSEHGCDTEGVTLSNKQMTFVLTMVAPSVHPEAVPGQEVT